MQTANPDYFFRAEADIETTEARRRKAERTKNEGSPIDLPGKPIKIKVVEDDVWSAEGGGVCRRTSLETGKTLQVYRGHKGPVTCLALFPSRPYLFTGSWDKTIRAWNTSTQSLICTVEAHSDFLKCLTVLPSMDVLISGGSDKVMRFWDLSDLQHGGLPQIGSASDHRRPVECLAVDPDHNTSTSATIFSADSMGVIKIWALEKEQVPKTSCRATLITQYDYHRTGINDMWYGLGQLWTASTDCTIRIKSYPEPTPPVKPIPPIETRHSIKSILPLELTYAGEKVVIAGSGDEVLAIDLSTIEMPETLSTVDSHWHDVIGLQLWTKKIKDDGKLKLVPMIVSGSLDGTVRRWTLQELLSPSTNKHIGSVASDSNPTKSKNALTEEEIDALLDSDED